MVFESTRRSCWRVRASTCWSRSWYLGEALLPKLTGAAALPSNSGMALGVSTMRATLAPPAWAELENGLDDFGDFQAGGYALADHQQAVQLIQARFQADAHLLERAAELGDLVFALHRQGVIQLALGDIVGFVCQVLQRSRDLFQAETQRQDRHEGQHEQDYQQGQGDLQGDLLGNVRRQADHDCPRAADRRHIVAQHARAVWGGVIEQEWLRPSGPT